MPTALAALGATALVSTTLTAQTARTAQTAHGANSAHPVAVDTYHGVKVSDPYRWLEDGSAPDTKAWVAAQNAKSRAYFDSKPVHDRIAAELMRLAKGTGVYDSGIQAAGGKLFAYTVTPGAQQPVISVLAASGDPATRQAVLDPLKFDASGHTAIDWFEPSPDGSKIAVSLSQGGSEIGTLHVFDVATGKEIEAPIPEVQRPTGGGTLAWTKDGTGFWYTRYPGPGAADGDRDFNMQAYFHRLGSDAGADALVLPLSAGLPRTGEVFLSNPAGADSALARVQKGDGGEWQVFRLTPAGATRIATYADDLKTATLAADGAVYGISYAGAPNGKLVRIAPGGTIQTIVPAGKVAFTTDSLVVNGGRLYATSIDGGPNRVTSYALDGSDARALPIPDIAAVSEIVPMPGGDLLYRVRTYTEPARYLRYDAAAGTSTATPLTVTTPLDMTGFKVTRMFATSKDGTRVPISLIARSDIKLDGTTPTILYGYGGYGVNMVPGLVGSATYMWLKAGGAWAIANIRGGGEYGEAWHTGGNLLNKQNVFDDFYAAAEYLKAQKVTSTQHLGLLGGSNGGLLMGATVTQHPGIAKAVVSQVGIYDMLRVETSPNGAFNVTEFGTVKDPAQFKALYAYSPLHRVRKGTQYPAMLLTTGDNDGRVDPMHSRKFVAALNASGTRAPVYLRTSANAGHGQGSSLSEAVALAADVQTFWFDQFGLDWPPAK
ncbi:prolyl oligopeptidase family serine peptidase [Parablastomonas sp. CN1-191]|uniref:prolyl oligopeptidase family serine peptidase n=1 Tax=Parablastomonas sp. CN1-191 TaxID=3400908 RepID=UPI003BF8CF6A